MKGREYLVELLKLRIQICEGKIEDYAVTFSAKDFYLGSLSAYRHMLRVIDDKKEICCGK